MVDKEEIEVPINHPLENILDIEESTTMLPAIKRTTDLTVVDEYDNKDAEIDEQFQEIYDLSLEAFDQQSQEVELSEGKYKARNGEIAVQYLNTALNAAKEKATLKINKDKNRIATQKISSKINTQNNLIVGDRNDIIKALMQSNTSEPKDITDDSQDENK